MDNSADTNPVVAPASQPISQPGLPPASSQRLLLLLLLTTLFLLALTATGVLVYQNYQFKREIKNLKFAQDCFSQGGSLGESYPPKCFTPTPTLTPTPTADPNNNQLASTFTFKLPTGYQAMKSSEDKASYGFDNYEYLVISKEFSITTERLRSSTECGNLISGQFCLNKGKGWGQEKDIADLTLGGVSAKSFYISGGVDNAYHVVQTMQKPLLELRMYVAGGGLDQTFSQILSTFKFLNKADEGTLQATVMRSPTCAGAQSPGEICEAPYANGTFKIIRLPGNEVVQTATTDKNGALTVSLASGTYTLQNIETGIGKRINNPNFTITAGKTTIQRFDVDTGIR